MRTDTDNFIEKNKALTLNPRTVLEIASDTGNTDLTYFKSHADAAEPSTGTISTARLLSATGISQTLNPVRAASTIGSITAKIMNNGNAMTSFVKSKLDDTEGLRHKRVRLRLGYKGLEWADYSLFATQIVESRDILDDVYTVRCKDIQRSSKKEIFADIITTLTSTISETATTITVADTSEFSLLVHGASYSDAPSATVGYFKIANEVIRYTGTTSTTFTGCTRGVHNTKPARHEVDTGTDADKRPEVKEFIYFELPVAKVIYGILTGILYDSIDVFPWNLGLDTAFVDTTQFVNIGDDIWDSTDDTLGFIGKWTEPKKVDAKKFIETECLRMIGCFQPVLNDGQLGLKRVANTIFDADYVRVLDETNIVSYSAMTTDDKQVHNFFTINWNWVVTKKGTTRSKAVIDTVSQTAHQESDEIVLTLPGLSGSRHTTLHLKKLMNFLRDRYTGPPKLLTLSCLFSENDLEVGDIVRVKLDQIIDDTTNLAVNRSFEIQNKTLDINNGVVRFQLFGSSEKATPISPTADATALVNGFYSTDMQAGNKLDTALSTTPSGGVEHLDTNGTLTGQTALPGASNNAVYWFDGDVQLDAGVTITVTENTIWLIQGDFTFNGTIDGIGGGIAASANGTAGVFGNTQAGGRIASTNYHVASKRGWSSRVQPLVVGQFSSIPEYNFDYDGSTDFTGLTGLPTDLRGSSGGAGGSYIDPDDTNAGGAGGAGGAGLIIICRSISAGSSASINLSGAGGTLGTGKTTANRTLYSGTGGAGAPGGLLVLLDGSSATEVDVDTHFTADQGGVPLSGSRLPASFVRNTSLTANQSYYSFYGPRPEEAFSQSHLRIQFLPASETPAADTESTTTKATVNSVAKTDNVPQTPAENLTTITVDMAANADTTFSHTNVYWKISSEPDTAYELGGIAPDGGEKLLVSAMDGTAYDIKTVAVSIFGEESTDFDVNSVTVANDTGGVNLATGNYILSGQTAYDTGTGFYIANDSGTPKFSLGNSAGNKMTWDGTTFSVIGTLTATTGTIGGWTLGATSLTAGSGGTTVGLDSGGSNPALYAGNATPGSAPFQVSAAGAITATSGAIGGWTLGATSLVSGSGGTTVGLDSGGSNPALYAGNATPGSAPFQVSNAGALTATNATITGAITATSGAIGGWSVTTTTIIDSASRIILDHGNARIQVQNVAGDSYTRLDSGGITCVDSVLGTTFKAYTDGTAPFFSSGIINTTTFNISTSGILETASTVGDGSANSAGIRINDTGIKGFPINSSTPNFILATADGSISALLGDIGGFTISATELKSGTDIGMDSSNKFFYINSTTYGNAGIMLDYNGGTPRMYCGDGADKSFEFDGTDVKMGKDTQLLGADAYKNNGIYYSGHIVNFTYTTVTSGAGTVNNITTYVAMGSATAGTGVLQYNPVYILGTATWDKNRRLQAQVYIDGTAGNTDRYIGMGSRFLTGSNHVSIFFSNDGNVYARTVNSGGTTVSSSLRTFATGNEYKVEIVFDTGTDVKFYVDDVLEHTETSTLPSGTGSAGIFIMGKTDWVASTGGNLRLGEFKFNQDP